MAVSLTALFISLGGVGYAATGGNFILGVPNDASSTDTSDRAGCRQRDAGDQLEH